jgi:hypothetical protein
MTEEEEALQRALAKGGERRAGSSRSAKRTKESIQPYSKEKEE